MNEFLPFAYWIKTRIWKPSNFVGYFLIVHLPILSFLVWDSSFSNASDIAKYILGYAIFMTWYEIFYIENDTRSIKFEKNPSIRNKGFRNADFRTVIGVRIALISIGYLLLWKISEESISWHLATVTGILWTFFLHNRIRENVRFVTFYLLNVLKTLVLGIVLTGNVVFYPYCAVLAIFMSVEYFARKTLGKKLEIDSLQLNIAGFLFATIAISSWATDMLSMASVPLAFISAMFAKRQLQRFRKWN